MTEVACRRRSQHVFLGYKSVKMYIQLLLIGALSCAYALPQAFPPKPNNTKPRGDTQENFDAEDIYVPNQFNHQDTQQSVLNLDLNEQQRQNLNGNFQQQNLQNANNFYNDQQRQNVNSNLQQQNLQNANNFYTEQQRQNLNSNNQQKVQSTQNLDSFYNEQQRQNYNQHNFESVQNSDSFYNEQQRQHYGQSIGQSAQGSDSFYNEQHRSNNSFDFNQNIRNQNRYFNEQNRQNGSNNVNQNVQNQNSFYPAGNQGAFVAYSQQGKRNNSIPLDFERGVCYTEVPTASLVKLRGGPIPAGNGSRPELSNIRVCCTGYIRNIHNFRLCDPVCSKPCTNSLCTAPDTCSCYPDHVKNLVGDCVATCPIGCHHGQCSGGECMCNEGYRLDLDGKFCIPTCKNNCGGFGSCTGPNVCECRKGYDSVNGTCTPHCDHCANGDCIEPNNCKCHQGYNPNERGECISQCTPGCGDHGTCTGLNVCSCESGYQQQGGSCKPVCNKPCFNGECVAPNNCRCSKGYRSERGECVPECIPECGEHGRCVKPNVCDCTQGYQLDELSRQCRPQCTKPCHNGQCIGNNQCKCNSGFKESEFGECIPDCPGNCGPQGQCVAPNTCVCAPGFHVDPDSKQCRGQPGAQLKSTCVRHDECLNGRCLNGECICSHGYTNDETQPNRCIPNCPGGCPNGVCSSPNFCICNMGYVKDRTVKGSQSCIKRVRRSAAPSSALEKLLVFNIPQTK